MKKDTRAARTKGRRADHVVGLSSVVCAACESEIAYIIGDGRPTTCRLCGADVAPDLSVVVPRDIAVRSRKGEPAAKLAAAAKRLYERNHLTS